MKDLPLLILLLLNLLGLVYLYLRLRSLLQERIEQPFNLFAGKLEERFKDLQEVRRELSGLAAERELSRLISAEVRKISDILVGRRAGQAGERVVEELLSVMPPGLIQRNVRLAGGIVEFALKVKGEKYVPVDSKFLLPDTLSKEEFTPQDVREILRRLKDRAKEVAAYLRDERCADFALMVIPDGLYNAVKLSIFSEIEKNGVIPIPYQILPQVLLITFFLWERASLNFDHERLEELFPVLEKSLDSLEKDLDQAQKELKSASNLLGRITGNVSTMRRALQILKA